MYASVYTCRGFQFFLCLHLFLWCVSSHLVGWTGRRMATQLIFPIILSRILSLAGWIGLPWELTGINWEWCGNRCWGALELAQPATWSGLLLRHEPWWGDTRRELLKLCIKRTAQMVPKSMHSWCQEQPLTISTPSSAAFRTVGIIIKVYGREMLATGGSKTSWCCFRCLMKSEGVWLTIPLFCLPQFKNQFSNRQRSNGRCKTNYFYMYKAVEEYDLLVKWAYLYFTSKLKTPVSKVIMNWLHWLKAWWGISLGKGRKKTVPSQ